MKLHERDKVVRQASTEYDTFYFAWVEKHDLTLAEVVRITAGSLSLLAKYQIRLDRHGDSGKPGDIE